ncbi:MAG: CinA family nicotinamide mononucleotide deamidase-related protein [Lewinellaceae bacterium]|nr:CinA family nicotinamide mononucleotide deamidase-related protein [Saprospiraceae bacterium]MCB9332323.1 CinA family nicotinamide mononucleotide deamidase-related protein [Lewinellaceae bacterium]
MTVYLLTIGDEILIGQIVDTNSAWMSRQLTLSGFRVVGKSSVADTAEAIIQGMEYGARQANVIFLTGGLGPTKDDVTKQTLADYFGSSMLLHQETYDRIVAYFEKIGRAVPAAATIQATLPDQALILPNKVGSAPGMWFEKAGKVYISLPGVPFEMQYLLEHEVLPLLRQRFPGSMIAHRTLLTVGEGESNIAQRIESFENSLPAHIKLAYLPNLGQVRLRLTGSPDRVGTIDPSPEKLYAQLDEKLAELKALLPDLVFGIEDESLESVLGKMLLERRLQFGTAESCTGGYIAHLITSVPGASEYFPGSIVSYSYEMKTKLLEVRPDTLIKFGAVSEETVREMVAGALKTLHVDVALAVSGIAGPSGGTDEKPVGTVWMAVGNRERIVARKHVFGRDRLKNIQLTGVFGLNMVRQFLLGSI